MNRPTHKHKCLEAELEKSQAYGEQLLQSSVMRHEHATKRTDQIDELKEELEAKDVEIIGLRVEIEGYAACRAELAALKAQKPVAWVKYARKKPSVRALSWQKEPSPAEHALGFVSDALYAEAGAQPVPCQRCDELKQANSALADAAIVKDGWQIVPDAVKQDAKRYQWLTADLSAADGREKRNELTSYRAGTLLRPTNIDGMYPQPTQPIYKAPDYLDELGRQLGRAIGLVLLMALLAWLFGVFK